MKGVIRYTTGLSVPLTWRNLKSAPLQAILAIVIYGDVSSNQVTLVATTAGSVVPDIRRKVR